jgi:formate-dependent nitrite reductase membrane component NrfD
VGYYNQPLLKPPVWTWEVPAYFFVGGVAGVGAVIAAVGALAGADASLVRDARWIAVIGALISPALLISDLGRPDRFLNMLRVFKTKSPMSVGAWTLAVFTPAVLAALIWDPASADASLAARLAGHAGSLIAAATGPSTWFAQVLAHSETGISPFVYPALVLLDLGNSAH